MPKIYLFLIAMAGVLLAGCGQEHKARETATSAQNAAAADSVGRILPPLVAAVPTDSVAADVAAAPEAAHGMIENPPASRIRRGATTLADVPDAEPHAGPGAPTTDSAQTGELRRFLLTGLPAAQPFTIRPGRDTMLTGAQGTQLLVPAGIWELPAADSGAVVTLELQEFYRPADMILAGLSTTAGPQLLETGGMLHLKATANGWPVQLRPGRFLHLRMPATERQPNMQVFEGVAKKPGQRIDWRVPALQLLPPAPPPLAAVARPPAAKELPARRSFRARKFSRKKKRRVKSGKDWMEIAEPEFATGEKGFRKSLTTLIDYPDATRARLRRGRRMSKQERLSLRTASEEYKERILRIVPVDFALDSTGVIARSEMPASTDAALAKAIATALRQLPQWEPAMFSTAGVADSITPGEASRKLEVYFGESGRVVVVAKDWDLAKTAKHRRTIFNHQQLSQLRAKYIAQRGFTDSMYAARPRYYDSLLQVRAAAELVRLRAQFTDTSRAAITQSGFYNELSSQGLQWINCDRFLGPGPLVTYGVNTGRTGAVVTLLFRGFKSLLGGEQLTPSRFAFSGVPLGKVVTVLAMRRENGITYLSTRRSVVGLSALSGFSFHPVTMTELRAELARLN